MTRLGQNGNQTDSRPLDFAFALQPDEAAALADDLATVRSSDRGISTIGISLLKALQARRVSGGQQGGDKP